MEGSGRCEYGDVKLILVTRRVGKFLGDELGREGRSGASVEGS